MIEKARIEIYPEKVILNGEDIAINRISDNFISDIYRDKINDYPKFFKMDGLSRLGFVAAEFLLRDMPAECLDKCSILLFNRASSLANDRKYQDTISSDEEFFPSPAIFVYTLPNIVTGEIAIRHKIYGETSFYVTDSYDAELINRITEEALEENPGEIALSGWLDYENSKCYKAIITVNEKRWKN